MSIRNENIQFTVETIVLLKVNTEYLAICCSNYSYYQLIFCVLRIHILIAAIVMKTLFFLNNIKLKVGMGFLEHNSSYFCVLMGSLSTHEKNSQPPFEKARAGCNEAPDNVNLSFQKT